MKTPETDKLINTLEYQINIELLTTPRKVELLKELKKLKGVKKCSVLDAVIKCPMCGEYGEKGLDDIYYCNNCERDH